MDPGGSELDSSPPQPENPCLIVEDSQPDSVGLEDDPESSYRALLARRLSSLQPAARSPVLELISSPPGSRCSQTDSQSESNNQAEPEVTAAADPSWPLQEESQVLDVCPHPSKKKFVPEDPEMDPGADSTTNCVQSDGGSSQFGFLELSQSQDLEAGGDLGHHRSERQQSVVPKTLAHQDSKAVRSEVSSSSSSESVGQSGRQLTVQVLLHSQNLQESEEPDQQDCGVLSSQEDLFDADKSGGAVDSTVSEPERPARPTATPAHSLQLLHLSGQGMLVQESLSQSSVDYVAPTQENFPHTPLIIPSSPTEAENERDEEPMDTSLPPEERAAAAAQDEPMETDAASRPHSPTSAPASQNASGSERAPPVPSQPELSHDVFVPTQSQEASRKSPPLPPDTPSSLRESAPFSAALQLSVNADGGDPVPVEEDGQDSQDTQIDELEEPPGVDTSDAAAPEEPQQPDRTEPDPPHESDRQQREAETNVNESSNTNHSDSAAHSCVEETPCSTTAASHASSSGEAAEQNHSTDKNKMDDCEEEEEEEVTKEENAGGASAMALVLSESQMMSPEPMEEEIQDGGGGVATDGEKDGALQPESSVSEGDGAKRVVTANGHRQQTQEERAEDALGGREMEGVKDKSLSDSSGDISFHFTLPKDGELIGPAVGSTPPPPVSQLKQTLRHSTPIEIAPFSEKPCGAGVVDDDDAAADGEDGKLSLRMKLVTPVEEGGSERFSLQKPALLEEEEESVAAVTTVSTAVTSPSVFTRVRQAHRQQGAEEEEEDPGNNAVIRGKLFASPQRSSQVSPPGCNSLPNSQSEPSQPDVLSAPQNSLKDAGVPTEPAGKRREPAEAPELRPPTGVEGGGQKEAQKTPDGPNAATPSSKARQRIGSQQPGVDGSGPRSPGGRGEPETPSFRRTAAPAHRRHVRTIQEVRTTVTRIITDVYYEDGREVDRRVTEESEEPVVDCQVLDSDVSPCRTGSSSVTSGDLGDISSLSSKASSLHHSSGGTSGSTGPSRPDFVMPPSRGFRSVRGGGGAGPLQRLGALAQTHSSSEDEPFACVLPPPPRLPASPSDADPPGRSDSLRSSPSAGSSFVGLRVVAKWSSNGYFYSGRIVKDAGDGRFRLRFDDGYECEVAGKDILLCDPIPLETEVTALLEGEYFSIGVVKGHKTEGQDLFYSVEKDGQRQWHNRTAVILSLDQGNRLREQHSLGPYEPTTPLTKASDISLDNLVEGKRRRRASPGGANTPSRGARTPGPSGKRKLVPSEENKTPTKRGRRGGGARAGQRLSLCNTSGSGSDLPGRPSDVVETHGPLPQNPSLFMGFAFMLTASSEVDRMTNKVASDDEEDYVQTGPYNKLYTESQLQAGGGFILPDFNEEQCKAAYQSLLVADQHCRTRKYLLCLASGIPCVSHIWVRDCCKENKLLNYRNYLLPAGVGPDDAIVEWHPRCSPFKALRVLLVSKKPDELWAQLVTMGGASSVRQHQTDGDASDIPAGKYDMVVADHTCPPAVERSVTSQEVPIVSPEWLVQSVICGERLGFNSRPQCSSSSSS